MSFKTEAEFEVAFIKVLSEKGWESEILKNYSEKDLVKNWADILFANNNSIDRLNDCPLTDGEIEQILEQITALRTPLKLNSFINGKSVSIVRDNPKDTLYLGKEISLKIYDRREIAAGQSRYQIVQQPKFPTKYKILNDRRGDIMLLINGMPVIHIELKKSGIPVSQAYNQIEKYSYERIFSGLFSLVQVFIAMTPEETKYFANPGPDGKFNIDYYFNWADFNNEPINNWKDIASSLLSIPMAHQLIGFYTVADDSDGVLKVMRSYQYYAAAAISDKVAKNNWKDKNQCGGYIWHTTGSGKTMTSFKSAQLIANSKDVDKVVFLMDRIELGTQSLKEYRGFADENETVQATENTYILVSKLKSNDPANTLIVTSIQKMSNIKEEGGLKSMDIEQMRSKRIVFIVDECHHSTFSKMLKAIKDTFTGAIFFGFTGTPIHNENQKKQNTTTDVFGNELHRYSIADGIRDQNVLGFDIYKVLTFKDKDIRKAVAILKANAKDEVEAIVDPQKSKVYYNYMDVSKIKMVGYKDDSNNYVKGVEDFVPFSQYKTSEHQSKVVEDICENFLTLSHGCKFHAIFATSNIPEAIEYYALLKQAKPDLKVTCLFDSTIDNHGGHAIKEDALVEIIIDYNERYEQKFEMKTFAKLKKDIALRLAHKEQYKFVERTPAMQIDLLIVVNQMLTGFDSKWVNTLYMDKKMQYESVIQAFSRTNRLFGPDKPFGTIRYYRKPHTIEQYIEAAVKLYSGDKPIGLFVPKLEQNLNKLNDVYIEIARLFGGEKNANFEKLPDDPSERGKFASLFKELNDYLEAATIQGFRFDKLEYEFTHGQHEPNTIVTITFDETTYLSLALRYKELFSDDISGGGLGENIPFDLAGYLTEIDTGRIDSDYMNSRFNKYLKLLHNANVTKEMIDNALNDLHKSFAGLTQEEQKYANIFLHDIQRGDASIEDGKTLRDYITAYQFKAKNNQFHNISTIFGIDECKLRSIMDFRVTEANINEFGRFDELKRTVDKAKAKAHFEKIESATISSSKVNIKIDDLLRRFILEGGFDMDDENASKKGKI